MDSTLVSALTGIAAGIVGAVVGGIFALKATKRQIEVMVSHSRGDVNERLYSQSLDIMKFFAEHPEVRPYFYDNKTLTVTNELERSKILATSEMVGGFMELVALQIEDQPEDIKPRWKAYLIDQYNSSAVLRDHIAECRAWYAEDFLKLLPPPVESAPQKSSGASAA
jgi:hypothetical protein